MTAPPYTRYGPVLAVKVRGLPVGQGNLRHLGAGRPAVHQNAKSLRPWRQRIESAVVEHIAERWGDMDREPEDGPVAVDATFTMPKPASRPKRRRTWPDRRPDLDHLLRACLDSLVQAGAIRDDARVVEVTARKVFPGEHRDALHVPGLLLVLWQVGDDHSAAQIAAAAAEEARTP